ncbi:MAG: hypothetical protein CVU92_03430 [Firmicutes bacterium HGW-Firmicutes-17]|jgi:hypothetical protein|nr:MAG: hypothetical protein CVU92_03430 [Firmicutes bacterium HGW-Firmicutes-17]
MIVYHYLNVDIENIQERFTEDGKHRLYLKIPFLNRGNERALCIIGQNPSAANKSIADRTILYLEKFVYNNLPHYSKIIMLNLYSVVDTHKNKNEDAIREECEVLFNKIINDNNDFLIVYGVLTNQKPYYFLERAKELKIKLKDKSVYKIDIGCNYAPHPGNPKILYGNTNYNIVNYDFEDIN